MNIDELKKIIKKDLRKIGVCLAKEEKNKRIYFGNHTYGDYNIYIDGEEFHLIWRDYGRGEKEFFHSNNYKEILFELYRSYASNIAGRYELKHRVPNQDSRIIWFDKELQLLKKIDDYYYQKQKQEIDDILLKYPFENPVNNSK